MSEDSSLPIVLTIAAWIGGVVALVISFMRAVIASVSAAVLEELHALHTALLDRIYDARRLGSVERTVLMVLDVLSIALVAASVAALIVRWYESSVVVMAWLGVLVGGIVFGKALVHMAGDVLADRMILTVARWLAWLMRIGYPLARLVEWSLHMLHRDSQSQEEAREYVAEELSAIMEEAVEEGTLHEGEVRILQNIMRVRDVHVEDVMTPRNVIAGLPAEMTIADAAQLPELQTYSRLPVWEGSNMDNIIGYVLSRDVLVRALSGDSAAPVRTLVRQVVFIPENVGLDRALEEFLKRRQHLFIVVDEYGGVEGLLTLEDVVETILGAEIVDEADRIVDLRQFAQQQRDRRIAQQNPASVVGQSDAT
ncbi:MAG: hypothetical protein KatS3mg039_0444 [Candidatus Kapaibacterium sp.]|nr:MAG: hypothetical protein KatS3mg039_0444 [Candidatus Kapabacteria bacterium]